MSRTKLWMFTSSLLRFNTSLYFFPHQNDRNLSLLTIHSTPTQYSIYNQVFSFHIQNILKIHVLLYKFGSYHHLYLMHLFMNYEVLYDLTSTKVCSISRIILSLYLLCSRYLSFSYKNSFRF